MAGQKVEVILSNGGTAALSTSGGGTQVNADWNATSGVAQILNKPTIPAAQIQSDWNQTDNTKLDFIKNKPAIPSKAAAVADLAGDADIAAVVASYNTLLKNLRAAGLLAS